MTPRSCLLAAVAVLLAVLPGPASATAPAPGAGDEGGPTQPRLLGVSVVPSGLSHSGTVVGGLSGIDRDPRTGGYVLIADDRSQLGPARWYTADIELTSGGAPQVEITGVSLLRREDGTPYPSLDAWNAAGCRQGAAVCGRRAPVDPEDIRVDPLSGTVWWSQEGDRQTGATTFLSDPSIRRAHTDGSFAGQLRLPELLQVDAGERGPRANLGLEAFSFSDCGRTVTSVMEGPLLQDGAEPTADQGALVRLSVQNRGGRLERQFAYPVDPVGGAPGANGVAAVLADPSHAGRYLVLERSVVVGRGTRVRVYRVDLPASGAADGTATDVSAIDSLASTPVRPLVKELVLDLGRLGVQEPGIVEGMTWGPVLPSGERSLVLVADDNFALRPIPGVAQVSQVIAVAVGAATGTAAGC